MDDRGRDELKARNTAGLDQGWATLAEAHEEIIRIFLHGPADTPEDRELVKWVFGFLTAVLFVRSAERNEEPT